MSQTPWERFLTGTKARTTTLTQKSNDGEATPSSLLGHASQKILLAASAHTNHLTLYKHSNKLKRTTKNTELIKSLRGFCGHKATVNEH